MRGYKKSFKSLRKRFPFRFFFLSFLFISLSSGAVYFVFFTDFLKIKEINVRNNKEIPSEEIKNAIKDKIYLSGNILFADIKGAVEEIQDNFPKVKNVSINRILPDKISIQISERKPIATVFLDNDFYLIDKDGVVYEKTKWGITPEILPNGVEITSEIAGKLAMAIEKFQSLKIPLDNLFLASAYRANIKTNEGWEAFINLNENISWQMEKLETLLKEKIPPESRKNLKYIDLRFKKTYVYPEI